MRRDAILEAALSEFYEKGLAAARLDDIAERAGVSKGTLYLYFSSKEDLFRGLIDHHTGPAIERIKSMVGLAPSMEQALESFSHIAPSIIKETSMPLMIKVMIGESQAFPDIIRHHRTQIIDQCYSILIDALQAAQDRGEIDIDNVEMTARLVFAPVVYSGIWRSVFDPVSEKELDYDALFKAHTKMMLRGLNYRPQTQRDGT
ncbi:MAG: TetR/AcrR family transcriptional regulator [Pseudomonadota bacterium]